MGGNWYQYRTGTTDPKCCGIAGFGVRDSNFFSYRPERVICKAIHGQSESLGTKWVVGGFLCRTLYVPRYR